MHYCIENVNRRWKEAVAARLRTIDRKSLVIDGILLLTFLISSSFLTR